MISLPELAAAWNTFFHTPEPPDQVVGTIRLGFGIQQSQGSGQRFQIENGNVLGDGKIEEDAGAFPVFRQVDDTRLRGLRIGVRPQPLSMPTAPSTVPHSQEP